MSSSVRRAIPLFVSAFAAVTAVAGCTRNQSQPKIPLSEASASAAATPVSARDALPAPARAALDLGNVEFRAGRYSDALAAYRKAAAAAPNDAAPYFGVYMTAKKLGDTRLADSASAAIAARNGEKLMLSDSSMRALHDVKGAANPHGK